MYLRGLQNATSHIILSDIGDKVVDISQELLVLDASAGVRERKRRWFI